MPPSTASSDLTDILEVAYASKSMRKGAPDTFIICDQPRSLISVGDIIDIDIIDGYRYRTWSVRIICVRVLEKEMVELAGYLHGPIDGALPTYMLFQCPRSWVRIKWFTALILRVCRLPTMNTIQPSHPLPPSTCNIKKFRERYRGSVDSFNPEPTELVGGVSFSLPSHSISLPSQSVYSDDASTGTTATFDQ
ncbi:uncharacterized protein TRAVEDRAFT_72028 [Trametes versicolor FP-101664 SS1]|uniref:uncharacterized protein n=1 Tax=Trametes versicolor (strain FP-101664) TaxID=717944 RepID=UPI0004622BD2|nr:uncharacterized protein TRAVEDRAFT_72028 [Trametes versicolor FP-101664 SS1]EIW58450.1 hypothetical protein TRAVEDRAFT_72028 [Trametes versicolor FP-101664 SS1]